MLTSSIFLYPFVLLLSYILGSIPFGLLLVRLSTGQDVRQLGSGRTGGTNAMRAAGFWAGLATALLDGLKAACAVWLARALLPGTVWLDILAPLMSVLGHNYSLFLVERKPNGKLRLRGGAGGAPLVGGAFGLWPPSFLVILPLAVLILYFGGYASVTTMSVALIATLLFAYRAWLGASPWAYAVYGLIGELLLLWSLLPNINRLLEGRERLVGYRARHKDKKPS